MDKKIILAVAGSGKTTEIINQLNEDSRFMIVTYTNNNYDNLRKCIIRRFGYFPTNITLISFFSFFYSFCYKPFLSSKFKTKGINYRENPNRYELMVDRQTGKINLKYYIDRNRFIYSNRISKLLIEVDLIEEVKSRLEKYFDYLFIDEVQDIAGNDFNFLMEISSATVNMLFVGDYFQHTYDTSRDGSVNRNLFKNYENYKDKFEKIGFEIDTSSLSASYRCSPDVCEYINDNLGIEIQSQRSSGSRIEFVESQTRADELFFDTSIIKLFYSEHYRYGCFSRNWGLSKGENDFVNVCIVLNKSTMESYEKGELINLKPQTKNKLYVACSRPHGDLYLVSHMYFDKYKRKK